MASLQEIAPHDQVRRFVAKIESKNENGYVTASVPVAVDYYPNRISLAPIDIVLDEDEEKALSDDEIEALVNSSTICHYAKWIDLQGPVFHKVTKEILVAAGEDIPLDPRIMQHVPTSVIGSIMKQLVEEVHPKEKTSRHERRRSNSARVTQLRTNRE